MRTPLRPRTLIISGIVALVLIPVVYAAGANYLVEEVAWDAEYGTYYYAERPGAEVIEALILPVSLLLLAVASTAFVLGAARSGAAPAPESQRPRSLRSGEANHGIASRS